MFINRDIFLLAAGFLSSCVSHTSQNNSMVAVCNAEDRIIKTIKNEKGFFDVNSGRSIVNVHTHGTVDKVSVYYICNPPSKLPGKNTAVVVSGKVRKSKIKPDIGGYTYYELEIDELKF